MVAKIRLGGGRMTALVPVSRTPISHSRKKATNTPAWPQTRASWDALISGDHPGFLRAQLLPDVLHQRGELGISTQVVAARIGERHVDDLEYVAGTRAHDRHLLREQDRLGDAVR